MEPLFMKPIYKDYIWGGARLKEYLKKDILTDTAAESWEISTNESGLSYIKNMRYYTKRIIPRRYQKRRNIWYKNEV